MHKSLALFATGLVVLSLTAFAWADPDPDLGYRVKFSQQPMLATPIGDAAGVTNTYVGHNEFSTLRQIDDVSPVFQGVAMADDFADKQVFADGRPQPVVHLKWWGSYLNESEQPERVRRFLIAWETDVPDPNPTDPATFSHPGQPLQGEVVSLAPAGTVYPAAGEFTAKLVGGSAVEPVYEYNAELACPFPQKPDTVYWLKIAALLPFTEPGTVIEPLWGWHNRDYTVFDPFASVAPAVVPGEFADGLLPDGQTIWHFQDDAVSANTQLYLNPNATDPCDFVEELLQSNYEPQNYLDDIDGPGPSPTIPGFEGIGEHSKDLAFELYTVPEPATLLLLVGGGIAALAVRRKG